VGVWCTASAAAATTSPKMVVTILIDDLGSFDTAVNNPDIVPITPNLAQLSHDAGLRLTRFYTFMYCSPTRRGFLAGRFPVHMSGIQAAPCDNTLQLTILPQKLKNATIPWRTHFVGKVSSSFHESWPNLCQSRDSRPSGMPSHPLSLGPTCHKHTHTRTHTHAHTHTHTRTHILPLLLLLLLAPPLPPPALHREPDPQFDYSLHCLPQSTKPVLFQFGASVR
jgi:arylsulfatase A-like enzyme